MKRSILVLITLTNLMLAQAHAAPLSTAFTYQGRLTDNGQLANSTYDFQFRLFDAPTNGGQVPIVLAYPTVAVSNGLFTTGLDFGSNVFNGTFWWLEISLRRGGTFGEFVFLSPRQPLTPTPNSLFAVNAALATTATTANGIVANAVSQAQLNTPSTPASGQVLAYNGASLIWTNASAAAWTLNGNAGTTPDVNFVGTADNQPLELRANGQRILRLEPNVLGPNVIGGDASNYVATGVYGATIAGGGGDSNGNVVLANRSAIGGGNANSIKGGAFLSVIGGGAANLINTNASLSSICGGRLNTISAEGATVGGGSFNTVNGGYSTLGGGTFNAIQSGAEVSVIAGGRGNAIQTNSGASTISGGDRNQIKESSSSSVIGGGSENTIGTNTIYAVIPGGLRNTANGQGSFAAGSGANALHAGAFVWSDLLGTVPPNFSSSASNEFAVRATGGVRFVSAVDANGSTLSGVTLPAGSGSWTTLSDRSAKTNFAPVDSRELLDRLAKLPLQSWNYKSQSESVRHIGPTAQDFHAAFTVGEDDQHISTVDADGVALAAIQALNQKLEAELNHRDTEIQALRQQLAELKTALEKQTTLTNGGSQ